MFTVLFTFPSRYLSTIGLPGVFSLTGWCRQIQTGFLLSRPTQDTHQHNHASLTGPSPSVAALPSTFRSHSYVFCRSYNPVRAVTHTVWANPLSLATTYGITVVFSSSAYLDVSVRQVRLPYGISAIGGWVAPFGNLWINPPCRSPQLIAAWHVLPRLWEPRHPPCALVHLLIRMPPFAKAYGVLFGTLLYPVALSAQHVKELFRRPLPAV